MADSNDILAYCYRARTLRDINPWFCQRGWNRTQIKAALDELIAGGRLSVSGDPIEYVVAPPERGATIPAEDTMPNEDEIPVIEPAPKPKRALPTEMGPTGATVPSLRSMVVGVTTNGEYTIDLPDADCVAISRAEAEWLVTRLRAMLDLSKAMVP